jgi:hypothetical protein
MPNDAAVIVGVPGQGLSGCPADAFDVLDVARNVWDIPNPLVLTEAASYANIEQAVSTAIKNLKPGGRFLYWHSSHGTQVRDHDGDESDRYDEAACTTTKVISDDKYREWFSRIPSGVMMVAGFDTCHSGTISRDSLLAREAKVKFKAPDYIVDWTKWPRRRLCCPESGMNHVLFAGCPASGNSLETRLGGESRGMLSYYFCKAARKLQGGTWQDIFNEIKGLSQRPQLEGPDELKSMRAFDPMPFTAPGPNFGGTIQAVRIPPSADRARIHWLPLTDTTVVDVPQGAKFANVTFNRRT